MARRMTAAEFADKMIRRLSAAGPEIKAGIEAVTENPMEKAIAAGDVMFAKLADPATRTKWEAGLRRTSLGDWKRRALEIGVGRIAGGIAGARAKIESFAGDLLPHAYMVSDEVARMPGVTLEDGIARASHTIRRMAELKRG